VQSDAPPSKFNRMRRAVLRRLEPFAESRDFPEVFEFRRTSVHLFSVSLGRDKLTKIVRSTRVILTRQFYDQKNKGSGFLRCPIPPLLRRNPSSY
jgi:hypothetical protein